MSRKLKKPRNPYDEYNTPAWVVDEVFKFIPVRKGWKYMEPCRSSGAFYNNLPIGSAWGEIREGVDYLSTEYNRVDCIITNPPYSLAQEFVEKAHRDADVIVMLLRLGFLESMRRAEFWKKYPLDHLVTLSKRPSFSEDGKTDGAGYALFIWDKAGRLGLERPFYWLSPEK